MINKYYPGEKWLIATKKGKGNLPLFCGNREQVISIHVLHKTLNIAAVTLVMWNETISKILGLGFHGGPQ